jgi:beta-glucosidase
MAWYPGREGGHAIADVLFGDVNPSGRLPVSFAGSMAQLPQWNIGARRVPHDLLHGYRYLDQFGHEPTFPFGFGLAYTTFALESMRVSRGAARFAAVVEVRNTGDVAGATVVQLYVATEGSTVLRAPKELKGFGRIELAPGESAEVVIDVADADLRYYDAKRGWRLEPCTYRFSVGFSARDLVHSVGWRFSDGEWHSTQ